MAELRQSFKKCDPALGIPIAERGNSFKLPHPHEDTKQEQVLGVCNYIDYNTEVDIDRLLYRYRAKIL